MPSALAFMTLEIWMRGRAYADREIIRDGGIDGDLFCDGVDRAGVDGEARDAHAVGGLVDAGEVIF